MAQRYFLDLNVPRQCSLVLPVEVLLRDLKKGKAGNNTVMDVSSY
jgi:hypothetical protein